MDRTLQELNRLSIDSQIGSAHDGYIDQVIVVMISQHKIKQLGV